MERTRQALPASPRHPPLPAAVVAALQAQEAAARALLVALQQETTALTGRSAEALREAVSRKELAVRALEAAEAGRREAMTQAGLNAATPGVDAPWSVILDLLRHCRDTNEANGQLALRRARQVGTALQVLRGSAAQPVTYAPTPASAAAHLRRTRPLAWA